MKLYASVTSERATKGQGGKWLDINIQDSRKVTFAILKVRRDDSKAMPVIYMQSHGEVKQVDDIDISDYKSRFRIEAKGNNQKGELSEGIDDYQRPLYRK